MKCVFLKNDWYGFIVNYNKLVNRRGLLNKVNGVLNLLFFKLRVKNKEWLFCIEGRIVCY